MVEGGGVEVCVCVLGGGGGGGVVIHSQVTAMA